MLKNFHDKLVEELNYKNGDVVRLNDSKLTIVAEVPNNLKERKELGVEYFTDSEKDFKNIITEGIDIYFKDIDMVRVLLFSNLKLVPAIGIEKELYVDYEEGYPIKDNILGYCSMQTELIEKARDKYSNILKDWRIPRKILIPILKGIKNQFIKLYFLSDNNVISLRGDIKEDLEFVSHGLVFCKNEGTTELNELVSRLAGFNLYGNYTIKTLEGKDIVSPSQLVKYYTDDDDFAGDVLETYKVPKLYKTIDKVDAKVIATKEMKLGTVAAIMVNNRRFDIAVGSEILAKTIDHGIATSIDHLQHISLFIYLLKTFRRDTYDER